MLSKIKKVLNNPKVNFATGLMIGLIIAATGAYAATLVNSKNVTYDNSNSTLSSSNVQDALDELYVKSMSNTLFYKIKNNAVLDSQKSTYVTSTSGIDFSKISSDTNGKGVYIRNGTQNSKHPIYYYRGSVTNNNVLFGGYCWKIVRTTSTGGIKLIYNGTKSGNSCNNSENSTGIGNSSFNERADEEIFAGYVYSRETLHFEGTQMFFGDTINYAGSSFYQVYNSNDIPSDTERYTCGDYSISCQNRYYYVYYFDDDDNSKTIYHVIQLGNKDGAIDSIDSIINNGINKYSTSINFSSTIKVTIDDWFKSSGISSKSLEDTEWCYDRTKSTTYSYYYSSFDRLIKGNPSLSCNNDDDIFKVSGGLLDYPVGLLTADEVMLAGGTRGTRNTSYYLYNNSRWWTGTPVQVASNEYTSTSNVVILNKYGQIVESINVANETLVRPSISLKNSTVINGGDGSYTNPYTVG